MMTILDRKSWEYPEHEIFLADVFELNKATDELNVIFSGNNEQCEKYIHDKIESLLDVDYRMDGDTQVITAENGCEYWIEEAFI